MGEISAHEQPNRGMPTWQKKGNISPTSMFLKFPKIPSIQSIPQFLEPCWNIGWNTHVIWTRPRHPEKPMLYRCIHWTCRTELSSTFNDHHRTIRRLASAYHLWWIFHSQLKELLIICINPNLMSITVTNPYHDVNHDIFSFFRW